MGHRNLQGLAVHPSTGAVWADAALNTAGALTGAFVGWFWRLADAQRPRSGEPPSLGLAILATLWLLGLAAESDHWLARGGMLPPDLNWRPFADFGPVAERLLMDASLTVSALVGLTLVLAQRLRLRQASGLYRPASLGWVYLICAAGSVVVKHALLVGFGHSEHLADFGWITPGGLAGLVMGGLLIAAIACVGSRVRLLLAFGLLGLQALLSEGFQATLASLRPSQLPLLGGPAGPWANLEGLTLLSAGLWPVIAAGGLLVWSLTFRRKLMR